MRVLLVEDDPTQLTIFSEFVRRGGHEVDTAASRQKALALLEEHEYDAAVIDLVLVVSTGDTVAERAYWKGMGVVIMSAAKPEMLEDLKATLELRGCKVHVALSKPFPPGVLVPALEDAARAAKGDP